jgi:hypothetical protein
MRKLLPWFVLVLAAVVLPRLSLAAECTEISAVGTSIGASGSYCLSANMTAYSTSGNFISIGAGDVVLDCRGYTLHNTSIDPAGLGIGIWFSGLPNVTIRNCRITGGFMAGIYAYQNNGSYNFNQNISITGNSISGALWYGILAYGTDIDISDNRIHRIGGRASFAMGIRVGGSSQPGQSRSYRVEHNYITDVGSSVNNAYGIYGNNPVGSTFVDNTIIGTTSLAQGYLAYGIHLAGGEQNEIRGNHVIGSIQANDLGIFTPPATDNDCFHNYVRLSAATMNCIATQGNY